MTSDMKKMLRDIEAEVRYTRAMIGRDAFGPRVMAAMAEVPRPEFVPGHEQIYAYANGPLPIGHGQTISQPYIVALMTDLLACGPDARVLEVGTGSGYQAAVLSRVVAKVYSVEIIPELAQQARSDWRGWATRTWNAAAATATRAGPRRRPSTASWLPPRRRRYHRR